MGALNSIGEWLAKSKIEDQNKVIEYQKGIIEQKNKELSILQNKASFLEQENSRISKDNGDMNREIVSLEAKLREEESQFAQKEKLSAIKVMALEEKLFRLQKNLENEKGKAKQRLTKAFDIDKKRLESLIRNNDKQIRKKIAHDLFSFLLERSETIQDKANFFEMAIEEFFEKTFPKLELSSKALEAEIISESDIDHLFSFDFDQIK